MADFNDLNNAEEYGKNFARSVFSGMQKTTATDKLKAWKEDILKQIKSLFGIDSYSKVMEEEVGKYLSLGVAHGIQKNDKQAVKSFNAMLEKLKYQRDFDIINEKEYYASLEMLRDKYFSKGTENWIKYTKEIYEYQKLTLEAEKAGIMELYDEVSQYADVKLKEILKKQQKLKDELSSPGILFTTNTVNIGDFTDTYYSLYDLDRDIEMLKRYSDSFDKINKKFYELGIGDGAGKSIMGFIAEMDMESALGYMSAILTSKDAEILEYAENLMIKDRITSDISAKVYKGALLGASGDALGSGEEKFIEAEKGMEDAMENAGRISAKCFSTAFMQEFDVQLEAIRARISGFNQSVLGEGATIFGESFGNVYNTNNTSYNISTPDSGDIVETIKRFETVKRLSGV